ncbi:MAG: pyruvate, water dikinase regulatory protein [Alphaproteobacteria bacterium]|nr:pyruvate, water dikinase regulatory protein [Alphaproteobacteria bacterium]
MKTYHLHLVSDATGETLVSVARAASAQFERAHTVEYLHAMIRSERQMETVINEIREHRGFVMFTLVNPELRDQLEQACRDLDVPYQAVLDPVLVALGRFLGEESLGLPGQQHKMNAEYFGRIDAMSFTMAHDDGQMVEDIHHADIVLVGVSRTSKTPTCIYLAGRGLKAANVPFVPDVPLPEELEGLTRPLIVGLTISPERLVHIRKARLAGLTGGDESHYVQLDAVEAEVAQARRLFARHGWPVIDVSRRSIEETAAAIYNLYQRRKEQQLESAAAGPDASGAADETS